MPALFSNRAACHLKLNDYYAAANDCSKVPTHLPLAIVLCETSVWMQYLGCSHYSRNT